jgi:type I restriction enzyme R subunit/putative DNA methylase
VGLVQSVTFRLADSLPAQRLAALQEEVRRLPATRANQQKRQTVDRWLDAGLGCCALKHPAMARVVRDALWHGAATNAELELGDPGARHYRLLAWCVMPNHVHVLIEPYMALGRIVQSWKSFTGRWGMRHNEELGLGLPGQRFWMREYWDRYVRDDAHLVAVRCYIEANPVKAGLCQRPEDWPWSSATDH